MALSTECGHFVSVSGAGRRDLAFANSSLDADLLITICQGAPNGADALSSGYVASNIGFSGGVGNEFAYNSLSSQGRQLRAVALGHSQFVAIRATTPAAPGAGVWPLDYAVSNAGRAFGYLALGGLDGVTAENASTAGPALGLVDYTAAPADPDLVFFLPGSALGANGTTRSYGFGVANSALEMALMHNTDASTWFLNDRVLGVAEDAANIWHEASIASMSLAPGHQISYQESWSDVQYAPTVALRGVRSQIVSVPMQTAGGVQSISCNFEPVAMVVMASGRHTALGRQYGLPFSFSMALADFAGARCISGCEGAGTFRYFDSNAVVRLLDTSNGSLVARARWTGRTSSQVELTWDQAPPAAYQMQLVLIGEPAAPGGAAISGDLALGVEPSAALDVTQNPDVSGALALGSVSSGAFATSAGRVISGDLALGVEPSAALDATRRRALDGEQSLGVAVSSVLDRGVAVLLVGDLGLAVAASGAFATSAAPRLQGSAAVALDAAAVFDTVLRRALAGRLSIAVTPAATLAYVAPVERPTLWDVAAADARQILIAGDFRDLDLAAFIFSSEPEVGGFHDLIHSSGTHPVQFMPAVRVLGGREQRPAMASLLSAAAAGIPDQSLVTVDGQAYTVAARVDGGPGLVTLILTLGAG